MHKRFVYRKTNRRAVLFPFSFHQQTALTIQVCNKIRNDRFWNVFRLEIGRGRLEEEETGYQTGWGKSS